MDIAKFLGDLVALQNDYELKEKYYPHNKTLVECQLLKGYFTIGVKLKHKVEIEELYTIQKRAKLLGLETELTNKEIEEHHYTGKEYYDGVQLIIRLPTSKGPRILYGKCDKTKA